VYLWRVFLVKPLAAMSIVICLVTIFSCFRLERKRPTQKADRFLIAFLGLLAIYQGMRILESAGVLAISVGAKFDDAIELLITTFYLFAALLLRFSSINRLEAESAYRLVRAAPPRLSQTQEVAALDPRAGKPGLPLSDRLAWAMPQLSDGAFKLFAWVCVQADASGKAVLQERDVQLRMKRSQNELEGYYHEIERCGAASIRSGGGMLDIDLGANHGADQQAAQFANLESTQPVS
jgi:hypothetical protein